MREIKLLQRLKHERIVELQQIMVAKGKIKRITMIILIARISEEVKRERKKL